MSSPTHSDPLARELLETFLRWPIYDPHSHIDPLRPAARSLGEILGYHYYTELAHSAGMPAELVDPSRDPDQICRDLTPWLQSIENTVQYSWLIEILQTFHDLPFDRLTPEVLETALVQTDKRQQGSSWDRQVWDRSNLEAVYLTNEFDDALEGFDAGQYIPCLRTDALVLKLHDPATRDRLQRLTGLDVGDLNGLRAAIEVVFKRFKARGARACAISLPPDFVADRPTPRRSITPLRRALQGLELRPDEHKEIQQLTFWMIAEQCSAHGLPFDLMIGPIRDIYPRGVSGGRDLFDRRVSLKDYAELFNAFPDVLFPVSTLSPDAGGELVAYSWIFPNVVPLGHWWYSNIPAFIAADLRARLQAVPQTKIVGYYSDAYKLEFVLPKFNMFRRVLAETLAEDCVRGRGWSIDKALDLGRRVLLENPRELFRLRS